MLYDLSLDSLSDLGALQIVHSLAPDESRDLLYVADRENARIVMVGLKNGSFLSQFAAPQFGKSVYSVKYCKASK